MMHLNIHNVETQSSEHSWTRVKYSEMKKKHHLSDLSYEFGKSMVSSLVQDFKAITKNLARCLGRHVQSTSLSV